MLRDVPRDTPGLKPHKTPPKSDLVGNPEPRVRASEYIRRWQEKVIAADTNLEPYRRPTVDPPKVDK
jgi:hypothetical protein